MARHDRQQTIQQTAQPLQPQGAQPHKPIPSRLGWLGAGLAIGLGWSSLVAIAASPKAEEVTHLPQAKAAVVATASTELADGVYLFGESPEPDQLGRAYLVFEVTQGNVIGAFYMPASEFDCTYGRFQSAQLALTVIDSYGQGRYPYAIALTPASPIAAQHATTTGLTLAGYYPIATVSDNDRRMLDECKSTYPISERTP
ncbi:hypothetical protein [Trichothermofontia sp.]